MKKVSLAILVSLTALTGAAYAQDDGVMMSTDPAKAADVEQRAQALQDQQQQSMQSMQSMQSEQSMPMKHHKATMHHKKAAKPEAASQ